MKYIGGMFWGVVIGLDGFALLLLATMMLNWYGVFNWLWDTTYGVWYLAGASAILGLSFGISKSRNTIKFNANKNPRGVSAGRYLTNRVPALFNPVKGKRG